MTRTRTNPNPAFIEPMECLAVSGIPDGDDWTYEIKLDGYRLEAATHSGGTVLFSRRGHVFNDRYPEIVDAVNGLPAGTLLDGEVVALSEDGRPNFNLLQNYRTAKARLVYYAFDVLVYRAKEMLRSPLWERRKILHELITPGEHLGICEVVSTSAVQMLDFVRANGLEGVVAKRAKSIYQPGQRSGVWVKQRINLGQEFVIGGYMRGDFGIESLLVGFYRRAELIYCGRVKAGFVPATRKWVFEQIQHMATTKCPFGNLPEKSRGRWGEGLTEERMRDCIWVQPRFVAQIEFLEWTGGNHLRHPKYIGLRDDKQAKDVVRET